MSDATGRVQRQIQVSAYVFSDATANWVRGLRFRIHHICFSETATGIIQMTRSDQIDGLHNTSFRRSSRACGRRRRRPSNKPKLATAQPLPCPAIPASPPHPTNSALCARLVLATCLDSSSSNSNGNVRTWLASSGSQRHVYSRWRDLRTNCYGMALFPAYSVSAASSTLFFPLLLSDTRIHSAALCVGVAYDILRAALLGQSTSLHLETGFCPVEHVPRGRGGGVSVEPGRAR
ncbi:hypothetical protein C8R44DRAFT_853426 [Mycena epipterygia]|nr:hypothetical protein C8R44DRAFT_853426 [Mycena epipterygia]